MKEAADKHFNALKQIIPQVCRLILFDFDDAQNAFHPTPDNPVLYEWKRKNIENYLLSPDAWIRAALKELNINEDDLFAKPVIDSINDFFVSENLTLPPGKKWKNLTANVFKVVDGKRILFENDNSLFQILRRNSPSVTLIRETVAVNMKAEEVHDDVYYFFEKLKGIVDANKQ